MSPETVKINRAPVMTLWAMVVAERLGFDHEEALSLAKAVTGLNAQSKGQRLGIFEPGQEKGEAARERQPDELFDIQILGRPVPAMNTKEGIRAYSKDKPVRPQAVQRYLERKFGEALPEVQKEMEALADQFSAEELARRAYPLYEKFRPEVPEGQKGWGAAGELSLEKIRDLKK